MTLFTSRRKEDLWGGGAASIISPLELLHPWEGEGEGGSLAHQTRLEKRVKSCMSLAIILERGFLKSSRGVQAHFMVRCCATWAKRRAETFSKYIWEGGRNWGGGVGMNGWAISRGRRHWLPLVTNTRAHRSFGRREENRRASRSCCLVTAGTKK